MLQYAAHAVTRMAQRGTATVEVRQALAPAQVPEQYPENRYGPSCLIFGSTAAGWSLHVVCRYPQRQLLKIITVYEPNPTEWGPGFAKRNKP